MGKKMKKSKKLARPAKWSKPSSVASKSKMINPIIAGAVAFTMILVLVVTVAPQAASNQAPGSAAGTSSAPRTVVDNSTQQQITALEESAKDNPRDADILKRLANLYYDTGQWAQAADRYAQVLDITPENTDVRTDMGVAYYYQGMVGQAIGEYNKTLEYEPNKRQTLFNLGIALANGNPPDVEGAVARWQKIIDVYPNTDDAKKAQEQISKYKK